MLKLYLDIYHENLFHVVHSTVLLKNNVTNKRLTLFVSRSDSHTARESKRTELKPYSYIDRYLSLVHKEDPFADKSVYIFVSRGALFFGDFVLLTVYGNLD